MNVAFGFENPNFLRGGWFVGPEEYEQMGYTLGLPPGYFAPDIPEVRALAEKLSLQGGIIYPSSLQSSGESKSKKKVLITNIPSDMTAEQLAELLTQTLLKRKLISNTEPVAKVDLVPSKASAFVEFKTQRDAEAAIQISKTFIFNGIQLRIYWFKEKINSSQNIESNREDQEEYYSDRHKIDALIVETDSDHLPPTESILQVFEEGGFPIDDIFIPKGFKHAIIYLDDPKDADLAAYKLNETTIEDVVIKVRKCYIGENEGPNSLSDQEKRRLKVTNGLSGLVSIMNPYIIQNPSIADILNPDVIASVVVQPETEKLQPNKGTVLCLYNIVKEIVLYDSEMKDETLADIENECSKYGEIIDMKIEHLPIKTDFAVVKVYYKTPEQAKTAQLAVSGRRYAGRFVITSLEEE